jgi:hypothetical protein
VIEALSSKIDPEQRDVRRVVVVLPGKLGNWQTNVQSIKNSSYRIVTVLFIGLRSGTSFAT